MQGSHVPYKFMVEIRIKLISLPFYKTINKKKTKYFLNARGELQLIKIMFLKVGPLRPPPLPELNGHRTLFVNFKRNHNAIFRALPLKN